MAAPSDSSLIGPSGKSATVFSYGSQPRAGASRPVISLRSSRGQRSAAAMATSFFATAENSTRDWELSTM